MLQETGIRLPLVLPFPPAVLDAWTLGSRVYHKNILHKNVNIWSIPKVRNTSTLPDLVHLFIQGYPRQRRHLLSELLPFFLTPHHQCLRRDFKNLQGTSRSLQETSNPPAQVARGAGDLQLPQAWERHCVEEIV